MKNLTIFGEQIIDSNSIEQIKNCFSGDDIAVLTADAHYGYNHPIGGAVAYKDKISLSGVGFDIGCGNKAVKTDVYAADINVSKVMDEIVRRISFGLGKPNPEPVGHAVLDKIAHAEFKPQRKLLEKAKIQLGTIGSGNHFVDLFEGEDGMLWIGVHFGSRAFGFLTTNGFIAISQGMKFEDRGKEGSMDKPPILFDANSSIGRNYIKAMQLAGEYAFAGRDIVVDKVLEILGAKTTLKIHNHHNFAWHEKHFGEYYWVIRKGCTPAFPGQLGFIGANMLDTSVIVEGVDTGLSRKGLYSTVHGAGRVMSRRQAMGKTKWSKGKHGKRMPVMVSKGLVDFDAVKKRMRSANIELRGSGADEAPECYKKLDEVIKYQGDTIKVLHKLKPIGVAMSGVGIY